MTDARWYIGRPPAAWASALRRSEDPDGARTHALFSAWVRGDLDDPATDGRALDRTLAGIFAELPDFEPEVIHEGRDERSLRRWCWARGWLLMEQDEDLLLMTDACMTPLLEEAAAGCTKRDYALQIVAHHLRDQVHHALWPSDGREPGGPPVDRALRSALSRASTLLPLARTTGDAELVGYLERLASYREPGRVRKADVEARVYDVRRCYPAPQLRAIVRRRGPVWVVDLLRANVSPGALHVEVATGRMYGAPA